MSEKEYRKSLKCPPSVRQSTTVISRTPAGYMRSSGNTTQRSTRLSMGPSFASGTISGLSQKGVSEVITGREQERKQMQGLNERFAGYIEKVRFLEAQNKTLNIECERLKKLKGFDLSEIKELYEQELDECRKIIKNLTEEKSAFDSTLVGLQDALDDEKREHAADEKVINDLRAKLDRLNDQMGEYEGEVATLRGRVNNLEDENKVLKNTVKRLQDDNNRVRQDLDEETHKRVDAEGQIQALQDQLQFEMNVHDLQVKELTALLDRDTGMTDMQNIWKGELQKAVAELQREYQNQMDEFRYACNMKLENQMRELESGVNRNNVESDTLKEEIRKLRTKLGDVNPKLAELEAENARLKNRLILAERSLKDLQQEMDDELFKKNEELQRAQLELENVIQELAALQDAKLSLELEISCYKRLLDQEEKTLQNTVESAVGARSPDADKLAGIIQQSSMGGYESGYGGGMGGYQSGYGGGMDDFQSSNGGGQISESSQDVQDTFGKATVTKSHRGVIAFVQAQVRGLYVELENIDKSRAVDLKGLLLTKKVANGTERGRFVFKKSCVLKAGESVLVCGSRATDADLPKDKLNRVVCEFGSWQGAAGHYRLVDPENNNAEKASMEVKVM